MALKSLMRFEGEVISAPWGKSIFQSARKLRLLHNLINRRQESVLINRISNLIIFLFSLFSSLHLYSIANKKFSSSCRREWRCCWELYDPWCENNQHSGLQQFQCEHFWVVSVRNFHHENDDGWRWSE